MSETPNDGQKVEILVKGEWLPATFVCSDSGQEWYWMDHYELENGETIPDDIHKMTGLPQWRGPWSDPRMNLKLSDMYHLSGDDKVGERVLPPLVTANQKAGF